MISSKIKSIIIDLCLDEDLDDKVFLKAVEAQLALLFPFHHSQDLPGHKTLGVEESELEINLEDSVHSGMFSEMIEGLEKCATKRQLAIGFFKQMIDLGSAGAMDKNGNEISKDSNVSDSLPQALRAMLKDHMSPQSMVVSESPEELLDKLKDLMNLLKVGGDNDIDLGRNAECDAEDDSECWKCKNKFGCKKFAS